MTIIHAPSLIIPSRRKEIYVPLDGPESRVQGRYKFRIMRPDGRVRLETDWMNNLITDWGLERLATVALTTTIGKCYVGSGNTPPATSDTTLVSTVATTTTWQSYTRGRVVTGSAPITQIYSKINIIYRFAAGVAAGNLSEVGVGPTAVANLYSRALILDETGAPTTITVLSDEVLDVYYEHRLYYDLNDYPFAVTIGGVEYTGIRRLAQYGGDVSNSWNPESEVYTVVRQLTVANGAIGPISSGPGGSNQTSAIPTQVGTYVPNSKTKRWRFSFGLTEGNVAGGIKSAQVWHTPGWTQVSFTPNIPKDATKTLTMDWDSSPWTRYTPP